MSNIDTMKYLETAISKDPSRYNLTAIYRDIDCMVATDGYRMHIVTGLPKIDKPHLLNGIDAQYPDYTVVIPTETQLLASIRLYKKQLKQLKDYVTFTGKNTVSRLTIDESGLLLSVAVGNITASILLEAKEYFHSLKTTGLKASQLLEALLPDTLMTIETGTKENAPLVIQSPIYNTKAVIMPCKLN